jgi:hypothetical protein
LRGGPPDRIVAFDEERLAFVEHFLGDVPLSTITRDMIQSFRARRKLDGVSNRTVNMKVGALRKVDALRLLALAAGRRDDGERGRARRPGAHEREKKRLFETAASNPESEHV